jgi:hypothetical protein
MNKLKYFRQGQEISIEELNRIVDNVNDFISLYNELVNFKSEIENAELSHNTLINNFISAYYNVIQETPNILEILNAYNNVQQPTQVIQENVSNISIVNGVWHIAGVSTGVDATGQTGSTGEEGPPGADGDRGFTVVPTITNQVLNWQVYDGNVIVTNHGLTLPSSVSLGGPQGLKGDDGLTTTIRFYFAPSSNPLQSQIIQATENTTIPNNYNFFKIETQIEGEANVVSSGWIRYRQPVYVPSIDVNGNLTWTLSGESVLPNTITGINIKGADGKSVTIKGSFDDHEDLPSSGAEANDAYLINGYLFVYVGGTNVGTDPTEIGFKFRGFENVGLIQGPQGEQGPFFEFQKTESHIQKKLNSENVWTNFIALSELTGPQGAQGFNIQLRAEDDFIQWKINDESVTTWNNLASLEDLKGDLLLVRQNGFLLEYRYDVNDEWQELFDLEPFIISAQIGIRATSPVVSVLDEGFNFATVSLANGYGDIKNPYGIKTNKSFLAAPNNQDGVPSFRALVASDIASGTISTDRLPTNAINQSGIVPAPTSSNASRVWKTDASGNPGWREEVVSGTRYEGSFNASAGTTEANAIGLNTVFPQLTYENFDTVGFQARGSYKVITHAGFVKNVDGTSGSAAWFQFTAGLSAPIGEEGDNTPPIYLEVGDWIVLNSTANPAGGFRYYNFSIVNNTYADATTSTKGVVQLSNITTINSSTTGSQVITQGVLAELIEQIKEFSEWTYVCTIPNTVDTINIVSGQNIPTFDWINYDYKLVYHGSTSGEDNMPLSIRFDDDTNANKYSWLYHRTRLTGLTSVVEEIVGNNGAGTGSNNSINTGLGVDASSSGGQITGAMCEVIISRTNIVSSSGGIPGWSIQGFGSGHYHPGTATLSQAQDGIIQTRFSGSYRQDNGIASIQFIHNLDEGGSLNSSNIIRLYKRRKF